MKPVIFGEVLFDRFPDGSVVLGGAPFNVAWHLQALGLPPLFVSRVGSDELGARITAAMTDWGMDAAGLQTDPEHPTGTVEVTITDGEPSYDIATGKAYDFIAAAELPGVPTGGILYHGSLALRSEPPRAALARLRQAAPQVLVDVNLRAPWWDAKRLDGLLRAATWAKLNEIELTELVPNEQDTAGRAAFLLEQVSLAGLIVTRGAAGAVVYTADGAAHEAPIAAADRVVDTVGAGDAFSSVVILGLARGWPWPDILARAQDFAAAVVGLRGATTSDRAFYEPFIANWEHP